MLRWALVATLLIAASATAQSDGWTFPTEAGTSAQCEDQAVIEVSGGSAGCTGWPGSEKYTWSAASLLVIGGGVLAWMQVLRWLPMMGGFTRLRKDRLLDHPLRAQLHDLIEDEPGIHFHAIRARTGKANGQVSHHLAVLVRAGLVATVRAKGYSTYFLRGAVDAPVMHGLVAVKSSTAAAVLAAVAQEPGAATRALARQLGRPESTVRHHCGKLAGAGLLDRQAMSISPVGEQVMAYIPEGVARPKRPPGPAA